MFPLSLSARYRRDLADQLRLQHPHPARSIDERDLAALPAPVQRYVRGAGLVGMSHASNARVVWREMLLRGTPQGPWMRMECEQVSFFREPVRLALMRSSVAAVMPFTGYDRYLDGHGEMRMEVAGLIPVGRVCGRHVDASALVTFLSEGLLLPSLLLESHVSWTALGEHAARAVLRHHGCSVSGVFHFDASGEQAHFETEDRWRDGPTPVRQRWSAHVGDFAEHKGLRLPRTAHATWHAPEGDFDYVRGALESVTPDVTEARVLVERPWLSWQVPSGAR